MAGLVGRVLASLALSFMASSARTWEAEEIFARQHPHTRGHRDSNGDSHSWAVKINEGRLAADRIARRYGFENLGEVRVLQRLILFLLAHSVLPVLVAGFWTAPYLPLSIEGRTGPEV